MNIHEHQAKAVLAEFGVAVPRGFAAFTVDEVQQQLRQAGLAGLSVQAVSDRHLTVVGVL